MIAIRKFHRWLQLENFIDYVINEHTLHRSCKEVRIFPAQTEYSFNSEKWKNELRTKGNEQWAKTNFFCL